MTTEPARGGKPPSEVFPAEYMDKAMAVIIIDEHGVASVKTQVPYRELGMMVHQLAHDLVNGSGANVPDEMTPDDVTGGNS